MALIQEQAWSLKGDSTPVGCSSHVGGASLLGGSELCVFERKLWGEMCSDVSPGYMRCSACGKGDSTARISVAGLAKIVFARCSKRPAAQATGAQCTSVHPVSRTGLLAERAFYDAVMTYCKYDI